MDQDLAKRLFKEGGILVFLDVPAGTEFGIDMKAWTVGHNFKGVKMIPPGIHYIYCSSVSKTGDTAPRIGFLYNFKKSEVIVRQWDCKEEEIDVNPVNSEQVDRLRQNIMELDKSLAPYPFDIYKKWIGLTNRMTAGVVEKLSPTSGYVRSALDLVSCNESFKSGNKGEASTSKSSSPVQKRAKKRYSIPDDLEGDLLPELKPFPGTELRLTSFPERSYPDGASPSEITKFSLDSSFALDMVLREHESDSDLIGELQFAFVCFLVGHSLEAFDHWKRLVGLLCSCEEAIMKHRNLFDLFVTALEAQLVEIPEEFLADIVTNNNFIYCKLRDFFRNVSSSETDGRLKTKVARFKESLTKKYLWDFSHLEDEDSDEAPVVVELD